MTVFTHKGNEEALNKTQNVGLGVDAQATPLSISPRLP